MRIISWNMAKSPGNWARAVELVGNIEAGVIAAQEARPPISDVGLVLTPEARSAQLWSISTPPGANRTFCSAVGVGGSLTSRAVELAPLWEVPYDRTGPESLAVCHPGQMAAVEIEIGRDSPLVVISMYGLWDRMRKDAGGWLYAEASIHRAISDLLPLLQAQTRPYIVLSGDWNVWHGYGGDWAARYQTVFDRLAAYGMEYVGPFAPSDRGPLDGCQCGPVEGCRHVRTYRHNRSETSKPNQVDFVFASEALAPLTRCEAVDEPWVWEASDHTPIVVDLAI